MELYQQLNTGEVGFGGRDGSINFSDSVLPDVKTPDGKPRKAWRARGYEFEKERCDRVEEENQTRYLLRDQWGPRQCAPPHLTVRPRAGSCFIGGRTGRIVDTIGEVIISDINLPHQATPVCENFRRPRCQDLPRKPCLWTLRDDVLTTPRRLDHALPQGGALRRQTAPLASQEPWVDGARAFLLGKSR